MEQEVGGIVQVAGVVAIVGSIETLTEALVHVVGDVVTVQAVVSIVQKQQQQQPKTQNIKGM